MQAEDLLGYLDAFGQPIRVKGFQYVGIVTDDYEQSEVGRVRVATSSIMVLVTKADAKTMDIALNDQVYVYEPEEDVWSEYIVRGVEPRQDGFVQLRLIDAR